MTEENKNIIDILDSLNLNSVCVTYRHDFLMLREQEKIDIKKQCLWWIDAIKKEILAPSYIKRD